MSKTYMKKGSMPVEAIIGLILVLALFLVLSFIMYNKIAKLTP
jgi:hypothetical protein